MDAQNTRTSDNHQPPSTFQRHVQRRANKAEQKAAFRVAIKNGANVTEASKMVGVARNTGRAWLKQIRERDGIEAERAAIASKTEVAETLTALLRDPDCPPPYKVNAAAAHAKLMGFDAPARSVLEVRQVPASVNAWLETLDAVDVQAEAIVDNEQPALTANSATPTKPLGE